MICTDVICGIKLYVESHQMMALHRFLQPAVSLQSRTGPLLTALSPGVTTDANEIINVDILI